MLVRTHCSNSLHEGILWFQNKFCLLEGETRSLSRGLHYTHKNRYNEVHKISMDVLKLFLIRNEQHLLVMEANNTVKNDIKGIETN